jgi:hypothetical protein
LEVEAISIFEPRPTPSVNRWLRGDERHNEEALAQRPGPCHYRETALMLVGGSADNKSSHFRTRSGARTKGKFI